MAQRKDLCIICNLFEWLIHLNTFVELLASARRCRSAEVEGKT